MSRASARRAAAFVLLVLLPLATSPFTVDLRPQKTLVFALALPLCAWGAPSLVATLALALGLLALLVWPAAPWEILAVAAAPAVFRVLSGLLVEDRAFVLRLARRAVLAASALALAGAVGLVPFETSAFRLPYPVLVGTFGNPNHLAAFLLLLLPLCAADRASAERRADRVEATVALILGAATILLCRSHLAALALAAALLVLVPRAAIAAPLAGLALVPIALASEAFVRAFEGRLYLLVVHARGLSLKTSLLGVGPDAITTRFLDWQAEHLALHPETARFWTFPEHPHDDVAALLLAFGLVPAALALVLARKSLRLAPALPRAELRAAWITFALLALGAGLSASPATWIGALLVIACTFRPRIAPPASWNLARAGLACALAWALVAFAWALSGYHHREAFRVAEASSALQHTRAALALPFDRARLLHLEGRILLELGRPREAADKLREATRHLPHPIVWKALAVSERAAGRPEEALAAARAWIHYRPGDPEAKVFLEGR
ncbi:tetratricopeptide repeat protein [Polyangium spumosum]|uniref:Tetratricopeptide repeat protein n=1 Tax=Polyangium spumosum TaxID=889282 RepID=A0A6N7PMX6_9BACT|nr:tetratricopeptide repeat protein [Polyangium spumosum]MRG93107.1 hypothetical protein [Polyangium spumosum]